METHKKSLFPVEAGSQELEEIDVLPISAWISLGLSIVGIVAIGMPQMLVFSALAIALGMFSLWTPAGTRLVPIARGVAYLSIALSCFIAATSLGKWKYEQVHMVGDAKQFGEDWLKVLCQGNVEFATELHSSRASRQLPGADLKAYYENKEKDPESTFHKVGALYAKIDLESGGETPDWKAVKASTAIRFYDSYKVLVELEDQKQLVKQPVKLEMKRELDKVSGNYEWLAEIRN